MFAYKTVSVQQENYRIYRLSQLLVGKKFDILKPLIAKTLVGINISVQLFVSINPVGRYRFIPTPVTKTVTSVGITL